jgi:uncharacterized membrane protein
MKNSLKTLAAVVIAALTLSLTGCTKDAEDLIIGSWEETSVTITSVVSGYTGEYAEWNGTHTETETPEAGESVVLTFNKDNTMSSVQNYEGGTYTTSGTYTVDGNKLTMTISDSDGDTYTEAYNIDNIDKKAMTLSFNESYTDTEDGQNAQVSVTMVINLTRK